MANKNKNKLSASYQSGRVWLVAYRASDVGGDYLEFCEEVFFTFAQAAAWARKHRREYTQLQVVPAIPILDHREGKPGSASEPVIIPFSAAVS